MGRLLAALLLAVLAVLGAAAARPQPVDLQLILAVDASGSVDSEEWRLQMQGYVDAFRDPRVHAAIQGGEHQAIAVTFVQWSGYLLQRRMTPWTRLDGPAAANAYAETLAAMPRTIFGGGTSLSGIIDYGVAEFGRSPHAAERRILDISGDGRNVTGPPAPPARDRAVAQGITINGLPILGSEIALDDWYEANVIGGFGSFMIAADGFESFGRAILAKLIREIALLPEDAR
ncbi:MAG: DUF1194 domain-containing protein [Thalassobaculales bacterium]